MTTADNKSANNKSASNQTVRPTIAYLVALLICGSNGIVASCVNLPSYQIVFFRMILGMLFLFGLLGITRTRLSCKRHPEQLKYLAGAGIALGFQWALLFAAYRHVGIGVATLEYYCGPVIVMALSPFLFHETLTRRKVIGFLIVLAGMVLIVSYGVGENLSITGLIYGALAAVLYAAMIVLNRYAPDIEGLEGTAMQLAVGAEAVGIITLLVHGIEIPADIHAVNWGALLILGLFNTGVGSGLYFPQLTKIPVQRVAVFGYLEPLSAVLFSSLLLGEPLGILKIAGAFCIIGGALFAETARSEIARTS